MNETGVFSANDICVCCGAYVPEGSMICRNCADNLKQAKGVCKWDLQKKHSVTF